jgi:hypothetical protein
VETQLIEIAEISMIATEWITDRKSPPVDFWMAGMPELRISQINEVFPASDIYQGVLSVIRRAVTSQNPRELLLAVDLFSLLLDFPTHQLLSRIEDLEIIFLCEAAGLCDTSFHHVLLTFLENLYPVVRWSVDILYMAEVANNLNFLRAYDRHVNVDRLMNEMDCDSRIGPLSKYIPASLLSSGTFSMLASSGEVGEWPWFAMKMFIEERQKSREK